MAVRVADRSDERAIVASLLAGPMSAAIEWMLAPALDREASRSTFVAWRVSNAFDFGTVFIDGAGLLTACEPYPLLPDHLESLYRGATPMAASRGDRGIWLYPTPFPDGCARRLHELGRATQLLQPPYPVVRMTVRTSSLTDELWSAWLRHADGSGRPASVVACAGDEPPGSLGFERVAQLPAGRDGRPAMTSWVRPTPRDAGPGPAGGAAGGAPAR